MFRAELADKHAELVHVLKQAGFVQPVKQRRSVIKREINAGAAYLANLKRSSAENASSGAAAGPQRAGLKPETSASESQYPGTQRRSTRYKCEGSAEIREEGRDVRTWATFTDISLHGCYVEITATFPVGTKVHLRLEANGFHINTGGCVKVTYPYLAMGVEFTEMSEENRRQLEGLVNTLSQPSLIMGAKTTPLLQKLPASSLPEIVDSRAALTALVDFFESRQLLMRDEFVRILQQTQGK